MDISQYRHFIAAAESRTITEAAEKLRIAQPALSSQLRTLEREYGATLIETGRGLRSIRLTDAGRIFYEEAKALSRLEENLRQEIADCREGLRGVLRLTASPSRARPLIGKTITLFHKSRPDVSFQLLEGPVREQEHHLLSGLAEIAIANAPLLTPERFDILYRRPEPFYVICRGADMLPDKPILTLSDLAGVPLALPAGCAALLRQKFSEADVPCRVFSESTNRNTAVLWAEAGLAAAVIPSESFDLPQGLLCRPVEAEGLAVYKTVFKAKDRRLSRIAEDFLACYEASCREGTEKGHS